MLCLMAANASQAQHASCTLPKKSASEWSFGTNGLRVLKKAEGFRANCYCDKGSETSLTSNGVTYSTLTEACHARNGHVTIGYGHACQSSDDDLPQYGVTCNANDCSGTLTEAQASNVLHTVDVGPFEECVRGLLQHPSTITSLTRLSTSHTIWAALD